MNSAPRALSEAEEDFFTLVAEGDVSNMKQFLKKRQSPDGYLDFNVNCVNFTGNSGMSVAVENGHFDMILLLYRLMDVPRHLILLEAVRLGNVNLIGRLCEDLNADEMVLRRQSNRKRYFLSGSTPLMEAASRGHFEIIGYLIKRGHVIQVPHEPNCLCDSECLALLNECDSLDLAVFMLDLYTAISQPAYIAYVTTDPVHYAFDIHQTLKVLSTMENSLKWKYQSLARDVRRFVATLVAQCRSSDEVQLVLQQNNAARGFWGNVSRATYPRLLQAIDNDWTELIAQPIIQLALEDKFYGAFHDWQHYSSARKYWHFLTRSIVLPRAYLTFLFWPTSKTAEFYASPFNKMLHFSVTYMCFLFALVLDRSTTGPDGRHKISLGKGYIFVYFCGFTAMSVHQMLNLGWKRYFHYGWNSYDVLLIVVFSLSFAFEIASLLYLRKMTVSRPERKQWSWFHPQLLAEGMTVTAYVLAFLKLLFFTQTHSGIGPLQVALYGLAKYVVSYSLFGLAILLVYTTAFSKFHTQFSSAAGGSSWRETFHAFFWAIFGLCRAVGTDDELDDSVLPQFDGRSDDYRISQMVSYAVFGTYTVLMVIVIKNMIVALAVKAFNSQSDEARDSWLVSRSQIFLYYIDSTVMPPPFNLLPQKYSFELENRRHGQRADAEKGLSRKGLDPQKEYSKLMKTLVKRYFHHVKHETRACDS